MERSLHAVHPNLVKVRYISRLPWLIVALIASLVWFFLFEHWVWALAVPLALLAITCWFIWWIPRQVHFLGWQETSEEIIIASGRLFRSIRIIPFGRVQYIDVLQGPLERIYGLKTIHIVTAGDDASYIPGLEAETAEALRERLLTFAKEKMIDL
ncbi:PH domain-containing protein [Corynebacterium sp. ES2794-CONJ1]|uniref:PH domain-containing protein n=1 Tax=unclassified Corynebacterium TaxID=2624378 RepID=UPI002169D8E2|nr:MULTISPECIES: PH domain-containing protein [unclassified Corynebacterium]MCS4489544.1 PH domain-containing protein [Corynebacterium sp. ES2775-CONJ]MCS4491445.1 PH domain-containing protein [Corynebacterium sp. ES2715-CONJ3]MCS4531454.1 PH domain-containing protein [Corynebacterium sp. ES2730-CONJ]MCU9518842.1 PH domain-containing protein [Corynebacterium sp. ES2794-CONJ1]